MSQYSGLFLDVVKMYYHFNLRLNGHYKQCMFLFYLDIIVFPNGVISLQVNN